MKRLEAAAMPLVDRILGDGRLDKRKLKDVDIVVVHGGSGEHGVAAGMFFQGAVAIEKGELPPILFSGKWSIDTTDDTRPRNKNGEVVTEAEYMKEVAMGFGLQEDLILTETGSYTTEENAANSLEVMRAQGINPNTVLFVSAHVWPKRAQLSWERYGPGISFIGVGNEGMRLHMEHNMNGAKKKYAAIEAAKTLVTFAKHKVSRP